MRGFNDGEIERAHELAEQLDRLRRSVAERSEPDPSEIPINPVFFPERTPHRDVSRGTAFGIDRDRDGSNEIVRFGE